jgi:hypothetical protein
MDTDHSGENEIKDWEQRLAILEGRRSELQAEISKFAGKNSRPSGSAMAFVVITIMIVDTWLLISIVQDLGARGLGRILVIGLFAVLLIGAIPYFAYLIMSKGILSGDGYLKKRMEEIETINHEIEEVNTQIASRQPGISHSVS